MYETIVVGTDGSARADEAVDHAIDLARSLGSRLHIVHAVDDRPHESATMSAATRARLEADRSLDQGDVVTATALARAAAKGVTGQGHNPRGEAVDALLAVAAAEAADLIVVGNKGMSGLRRFVLGSVPSRLARRCAATLLIVDTDASTR